MEQLVRTYEILTTDTPSIEKFLSVWSDPELESRLIDLIVHIRLRPDIQRVGIQRFLHMCIKEESRFGERLFERISSMNLPGDLIYIFTETPYEKHALKYIAAKLTDPDSTVSIGYKVTVPRENSRFNKATKFVDKICRLMKITRKDYRKMVSVSVDQREFYELTPHVTDSDILQLGFSVCFDNREYLKVLDYAIESQSVHLPIALMNVIGDIIVHQQKSSFYPLYRMVSAQLKRVARSVKAQGVYDNTNVVMLSTKPNSTELAIAYIASSNVDGINNHVHFDNLDRFELSEDPKKFTSETITMCALINGYRKHHIKDLVKCAAPIGTDPLLVIADTPLQNSVIGPKTIIRDQKEIHSALEYNIRSHNLETGEINMIYWNSSAEKIRDQVVVYKMDNTIVLEVTGSSVYALEFLLTGSPVFSLEEIIEAPKTEFNFEILD